MTFKLIISCLALLAMAIAPCNAQTQSRLSSDIIDTYTRMIAEKPGSADLRLSRATEYASQGLLALALTDLDDALRIAPDGEKGIRFEILTQRAAIHERQMNLQLALDDINAAAGLYSDVPSLKLSRGRLLAALGRNTEAREAFNSYRRTDPRSSEALFGLAEIAAREGDSNTALGLADDAVEANGRTSEAFMRRAGIYEILRRPDEVVAEYIRALSCNDAGAADAMQKLADMSYDDYNTVTKGFDRAIDNAPTSGMLYLLRGTMAQAHEHHRQALADFETIDGTGPYTHGELNPGIAVSLIATARYEEAMERLDLTPGERGVRDADWYLLRARALRALGRTAEALAACDSAMTLNPDNPEGMAERARLLATLGRKDEAARQSAEMMMTAVNPMPKLYFLRASLMDKSRSDRLMEEVLELPFSPADPLSLRGFALLALGRTDEAIIWANSIMRHDTAHDGIADFTAACLFARAGKPEEALRALSTAIARGYDNMHMIHRDDTPGISIVPLRSNPAFPKL